jgi:hypothetical protein
MGSAEWNKANRDKTRAATAKHRAKNKDKLNADAREVYKLNIQKGRAKSLSWYYRNKERAQENNSRWLKANKARVNAAATARRYRNLEKFRAKERREAGLPIPSRPCPEFCESCGGPPYGRHKVLALDHCHVTGVFRGWLCSRCNMAFGFLGDDLAGVENLLRYAKRFTGS